VRVGCVAAATLRPSRIPRDVFDRVSRWAAPVPPAPWAAARLCNPSCR